MVQSAGRPASQPPSHLLTSLLTAALLVGVVDSFLSPTAVPLSPSRSARAAPSSYNGEISAAAELADHVAADARPASLGAQARAWPPLRQVSSGPGSRRPATALSMLGGRARSPSMPRVSAVASAGTATAAGYPFSGSTTRRGAKLALSPDHRGHDGGDQGGNAGGGGHNNNGSGKGRGNGSGNGDGNGDDNGGESCGDDGFDDRGLLLAGAGTGLAGALDGLKEAMGNVRMPWSRKVREPE